MEPGCTLEGFDRPAQPAVSNRLRYWTLGGVWTIYSVNFNRAGTESMHGVQRTFLILV
jgi:hypothetical protein